MKNKIKKYPEVHVLTQHEINKKIMVKDETNIDFHIYDNSKNNNFKAFVEKQQHFNEFVKKIQRFNEDISTNTKPRLYKDYCFNLREVFGNSLEVKQDECSVICPCKEQDKNVKKCKQRTIRVLNFQKPDNSTNSTLHGSNNISTVNSSNLQGDFESKSGSGSIFPSKNIEICNIEPWLRRHLILCKFITAARKIILRNRLIRVLNILKKVTKDDIKVLSKQHQTTYNISYANIFQKFIV